MTRVRPLPFSFINNVLSCSIGSPGKSSLGSSEDDEGVSDDLETDETKVTTEMVIIHFYAPFLSVVNNPWMIRGQLYIYIYIYP